MGGNSLQGVGAAGRGEECRQKRERSLERTTCHFKQFGLHPKVNMEATEQFCRVMEPDHSVLDGNKKRFPPPFCKLTPDSSLVLHGALSVTI